MSGFKVIEKGPPKSPRTPPHLLPSWFQEANKPERKRGGMDWYWRWSYFTTQTLKSLSVSFSDKNALKKEQNFIIHEQKSLAHHVIYKQSLSSLIHCALMCTNSPFCKSVNFISEQGGNFGECQLNDATAEDFPFHLMRVSNSAYSVVYSS